MGQEAASAYVPPYFKKFQQNLVFPKAFDDIKRFFTSLVTLKTHTLDSAQKKIQGVP